MNFSITQSTYNEFREYRRNLSQAEMKNFEKAVAMETEATEGAVTIQVDI
jgi:hypothetical protein